MTTQEHLRLREITDDIHSWRRFGPYLSERSWGTVREDYSADGNAWDYLPHELARSKAYRWGEDGIAGICDRYQLLCFAPAFWNGRDPILKERLFGLTPAQGNHGEDVKECYFHLDNTPTHSYMKYLYKYPQNEFPYALLEQRNRASNTRDREFELIDTGIFDDHRYFDIFIEYAKVDTEDICIRIEAFNRGPDPAPLHILPHLWFRNTWSWNGAPGPASEPAIRPGPSSVREDYISLATENTESDFFGYAPIHYRLGPRTLYGSGGGELLFTYNESNMARVVGPGTNSRRAYVKDAFHRAIVNREDTLNPENLGSKAAIHYFFPAIPAGGSVVIRMRLCPASVEDLRSKNIDYFGRDADVSPLALVDEIMQKRRVEADEFYDSIHKATATAEERLVQRRAFAGLLWSKQNYFFDVDTWLRGDASGDVPPSGRAEIRNRHWRHFYSTHVMTMPDKWEFPWFAAWDLAFQCVSYAAIDPAFAKDQLCLLLFEQFQHPNGQIPAYEWDFSDLNPPVHAWAVWRVFKMGRRSTGVSDRAFLERCFHKLLINFAWWINKVDREGNNIFEGGFLGLDNITVVDRSLASGHGVVLEQADATGWMGMFCLNMMRMALELAIDNPTYEGLAVKFFQHYVYVAAAMTHMGSREYQLWDDEDGFFYDVIRFPDGRYEKLRVRSLVGLIPLFAVERLETECIKQFKEFSACLDWFLKNRQDLVRHVVHMVERPGGLTYVLTIVNDEQIARLLSRVCDEKEFLSEYGVRSLSKFHEKHPFEFDGKIVGYEPGESLTKIKGGNSNWRGPIWLPTNFLLIESLRRLGKAYGPGFRVVFPGSSKAMSLPEIAREISDRLIRLFTRQEGRRACHGTVSLFHNDPHWQDLILFYEHFHGDTGSGLGASHQTGWTALVASLIDEWRE